MAAWNVVSGECRGSWVCRVTHILQPMLHLPFEVHLLLGQARGWAVIKGGEVKRNLVRARARVRVRVRVRG